MHHQGQVTTEVGGDHFRSTGVKLWATVPCVLLDIGPLGPLPCTVAQSLTPVDLKWSSPTSVVSWPWWCIDYISRKNEICFGALFKISKKIVLFYYIFYHNSLWWIFLIILTADFISDNSFRFVWYVTLYTFAKEIKS